MKVEVMHALRVLDPLKHGVEDLVNTLAEIEKKGHKSMIMQNLANHPACTGLVDELKQTIEERRCELNWTTQLDEGFAELKKHGSASDFHDLKQYAAIMTEMKKVMQTLTDLIKELKKNKAQLLLQNAEEAVSDLVMTLDTLRKRATLLACRGIINDDDGFDLAALRSANDLVVIQNLKTHTSFNGVEAVVVDWLPEAHRWRVEAIIHQALSDIALSDAGVFF